MKKKIDECENCNYRSLCVRSDYAYALTFECPKVKRLQKKRWWKKIFRKRGE
jgi:hypothetical protein